MGQETSVATLSVERPASGPVCQRSRFLKSSRFDEERLDADTLKLAARDCGCELRPVVANNVLGNKNGPGRELSGAAPFGEQTITAAP